MKLHDLPLLPREKLQKFGVESLSDVELLCVILGSGSQTRDVYSLAHDVLQKLKFTVTLSSLLSIPGIGIAQAGKLCAMNCLFSRLKRQKPTEQYFTNAKKVHSYFSHIADAKQEEFHVLLLNSQLQLIHCECVFRGTLDSVTIHPREIFNLALAHRAHSIILMHNHPSGLAKPSSADIEITDVLVKAGDIIGIPIIDHIIITEEKFWSYAESHK